MKHIHIQNMPSHSESAKMQNLSRSSAVFNEDNDFVIPDWSKFSDNVFSLYVYQLLYILAPTLWPYMVPPIAIYKPTYQIPIIPLNIQILNIYSLSDKRLHIKSRSAWMPWSRVLKCSYHWGDMTGISATVMPRSLSNVAKIRQR